MLYTWQLPAVSYSQLVAGIGGLNIKETAPSITQSAPVQHDLDVLAVCQGSLEPNKGPPKPAILLALLYPDKGRV